MRHLPRVATQRGGAPVSSGGLPREIDMDGRWWGWRSGREGQQVGGIVEGLGFEFRGWQGVEGGALMVAAGEAREAEWPR